MESFRFGKDMYLVEYIMPKFMHSILMKDFF